MCARALPTEVQLLPPQKGEMPSLELKRSQTAPSRGSHKGKVGARAVLDARHQHVEPASQLRLVTMASVEPSSQLRELLHRMKSFGRAHTKTPRASAKKKTVAYWLAGGKFY